MHLHVVAIHLDLLLNLLDHFLVAVLSGPHSHFVLTVLVTFENVDDSQRHG